MVHSYVFMTWRRCCIQARCYSKHLPYLCKPLSGFLEKKGCSRPRQLALTNRYLYKVHWWIYSLSLTTEISSNLSQMPSAILDITPALTPPPHSSLSTADANLTPLSVCWSISGWWCEGWSLPFVSWFNSSMLFQTVYRKTWRCLLPPRAVSFKGEKERELSGLLSQFPPSLPSPPSSGLDLTQQQLVIWLCETSQAISAG